MKKRTKIFISYAGGVAVFAVIIALFVVYGGGNNASPIYSASALSVAETNFDFGSIKMGDGTVSHQFQVINEGTEAITITKVYTSCMCTTASVIDGAGKTYGAFGMPGHGGSPSTFIEIQPGETAEVEAVFDPAAHGPSGVGLAQRSVYIETNSQTSPKLELKFQAMVMR